MIFAGPPPRGMALFIKVLAFHGFFGPSNGRFRGCFIDLLPENGHIGELRRPIPV
jgi:hypothetical protein